MKEGKYKKAEKYYDSIFEGVETESLPLPDRNGEIPERGYLPKEMDTKGICGPFRPAKKARCYP